VELFARVAIVGSTTVPLLVHHGMLQATDRSSLRVYEEEPTYTEKLDIE
jgi:hypothetical protein